MEEIKKQAHYYWVDALRFVSVLLVITIHVSAPILFEWKNLSYRSFMIGNLYDSFSRVCVPLFFMLSGYLLLSKQESKRDFYRKRLRKILIPFVAWSFLYLLWDGYYSEGGYSFVFFVKSLFYEMVRRPTAGHLWFFYALISIYLIVPILRRFVSAASTSDLWYLVGLWFISEPVLFSFEKFSGIDIRNHFAFLLGYLGYFLLGYILSRHNYTRKQVIFFFVLYVFLSAETAILTRDLSFEKDRLFLYFYGDFTPNIVLMSASFFILFRYWAQNEGFLLPPRISSLLKVLGQTSFGVYLIHGIVLSSLERGYFGFTLSYKTGDPMFFVPLTVIVIYFISFVAVFLLRKIPVLRAIIW